MLQHLGFITEIGKNILAQLEIEKPEFNGCQTDFMIEISYPYKLPTVIPQKIFLGDHLNGIHSDLYNDLFDAINRYAKQNSKTIKVYTHTILPAEALEKRYTNLQFRYLIDRVTYRFMTSLLDYNVHPEPKFQDFICSFNGSDHVSRKLLVAALQRWRYFNPKTCSKNFRFTVDKLDGHLSDYLDPNRLRFCRRFFIEADSKEFFDEIYSFGHERFDHARNIYNLERQLTSSFLHVISESMATSYYPFVTEKFLYSVVTRGLFLAYAQPGWHDHVERYYGFRRYDRLFDYKFDTIQNPVERLLEIMSMISKFAVLGTDDWRDLYEMEIDTIQYNYDHYFSGRYLDSLKEFVNV